MNKTKLATVTVTYNRKDLLLKNLRAVMDQTYDIDAIIIIDNHSTDGSRQAVEDEFHSDKIHYVYLDENTGGAGGFYAGCKYSYEHGFDWTLLMDDDGRPMTNDTIKNLVCGIESQGLTADDKVFANSLVLVDDSKLTFGLFNSLDTVESVNKVAVDNIVKDRTCPFNGTLISKGLMKEIGYPMKEFFISMDETNYMHRALSAGGYVATVTNSLYYHPTNLPDNAKEISFFGRKVIFSIVKPWKMYYMTRNGVYTYKTNKKVMSLYAIWKSRIKDFLSILIVKCEKMKTIRMFWKGYFDGKRGKLGKTIEPI